MGSYWAESCPNGSVYRIREADIGIIALSLALSSALKEKGKYWEVPLESYPRMDQGGVILSWTKDIQAAQAYRTFLISEPSRKILKRYGFFMPEK